MIEKHFIEFPFDCFTDFDDVVVVIQPVAVFLEVAGRTLFHDVFLGNAPSGVNFAHSYIPN